MGGTMTPALTKRAGLVNLFEDNSNIENLSTLAVASGSGVAAPPKSMEEARKVLKTKLKNMENFH
jgi:hypothetical protein